MFTSTLILWLVQHNISVGYIGQVNLENTGTYSLSMVSDYNSRYRPAEVLYHNNQAPNYK